MVNAKVAELRAAVNKAVGAEVLHLGSDEKFIVKYIPTGLLPIDILLRGGFPRGRFTMIQGDWSTLKTYIGLCACKKVQDEGGTAALVDQENTYDKAWAQHIGINTDDLILVDDVDSAEQALDSCEALVRGGVDLIVFDSVAAALPQAEAEKRLHKENVQPGRQAALFSLASRKLTTANSHTAFIWINQLRENIGMTFGPREKAPGGRALPFYSSYIIDIRKVGKINKDEQMYTGDKWQSHKVQVGQRFKAELLKSKLNKPFRDVWFDWSMVDAEIDLVAFLFTQGIEQGVIMQKGSSYTYDGKKVVGKDKFKAYVAGNQAVIDSLTFDVLQMHDLPDLAKLVAPKPKKAKSAPAKSLSKKKSLTR